MGSFVATDEPARGFGNPVEEEEDEKWEDELDSCGDAIGLAKLVW